MYNVWSRSLRRGVRARRQQGGARSGANVFTDSVQKTTKSGCECTERVGCAWAGAVRKSSTVGKSQLLGTYGLLVRVPAGRRLSAHAAP
eukprot:7109835-Pyramimonas_sp.AAC.1